MDFLDLVEVPGTSVPGPGAPLFTLASPVPNPVTAGTEVRFSLAASARVALTVHELSGRQVKTLLAGFMPPGAHRARWEAEDEEGRRVPAGVYFLRLSADDRTTGKKLIVLH